jgi:hypothetical protein
VNGRCCTTLRGLQAFEPIELVPFREAKARIAQAWHAERPARPVLPRPAALQIKRKRRRIES